MRETKTEGNMNLILKYSDNTIYSKCYILPMPLTRLHIIFQHKKLINQVTQMNLYLWSHLNQTICNLPSVSTVVIF